MTEREVNMWILGWLHSKCMLIGSIKHPDTFTLVQLWNPSVAWPRVRHGRLHYSLHVSYVPRSCAVLSRINGVNYQLPLSVLMLSEDEIREADLTEYRT